MAVKILIADDERHICQELNYIINNFDSDVKVKSASSGTEALSIIQKDNPEIIFLDINMPGINGIDLAQIIKEMNKQPYIVYITAYDQYAVDAFKVGAKGYILKPFLDKEIIEHLQQALNYIKVKGAEEVNASPIEKIKEKTYYLHHLAGIINGKTYIVNVNDIRFVYANNRSVYFNTKNTEYLLQNTLSYIESKLNPEQFVRCHRNFIVNINQVRELVPWFNSTYIFVLNDDKKTEIPISRSYKDQIKQLFGMFKEKNV